MNRRQLLTSTGVAAGAAVTWNSLLSPVKAIAGDVKPVRIKEVENFAIVIPVSSTEADAGVMSRIGVTSGDCRIRSTRLLFRQLRRRRTWRGPMRRPVRLPYV